MQVKQLLLHIRVCMGRVEEIFRPNPLWWVKKLQPNPTHHKGSTVIIIIKLSSTKYILLATWANKQNIHGLIFQLSYKQNILNWVD